MIKFGHLKKACDELDFKLDKEDPFVTVANCSEKEVIYLSKNDPWGIGFYTSFDRLIAEEKAMLIKAITKDYEEFINGDE